MINLLCSIFTPPGPPEHIKILTTQGKSVSHPHFVYERLSKSQHYNSKDIAILELCKLLSSKHINKHIALITEDKNMRIRARSTGIGIFSKNKVEKLMRNGLH
jgi:predicted ribonuclease YlaK